MRKYTVGSGTKEDPHRHIINEEFITDLENGNWTVTMITAAAKEIRRLQEIEKMQKEEMK